MYPNIFTGRREPGRMKAFSLKSLGFKEIVFNLFCFANYFQFQKKRRRREEERRRRRRGRRRRRRRDEGEV